MRVANIERQNRQSLMLSALEYVIALFCILMLGGIWLRQINSTLYHHSVLIDRIVFLLILIWFFISTKKHIEGTKQYYIFFTVTIGCMLLMLVSSMSQLAYSIHHFFVPAFLALLIGCFVKPERFWRLMDKYVNLMIIIAISSLILWILGPVLHIFPTSGTTQFYWDEIRYATNYHNLYYQPWWQRSLFFFGMRIPRNCAIFTEAPMYGFLLNLAYAIYRMKDRPQQKMIISIMMIIVTLTTGSTTAIIFLIIFEVINYGLKSADNVYVQLIKVVLVMVIASLALYIIQSLILDKLNSGSGSVRRDHLQVSWILFKSTFPFGCGVGNNHVFDQLETYRQGMSIGLPSFYARTGLSGIIITLWPMAVLIAFGMKKKKPVLIAFSAAFLWSNICTVVQLSSPVVWFVFFYMARGGEFQYVNTLQDQKNRNRVRVKLKV